MSAVQETWVRSEGQEDPLEKGMAIHSSILAGRIPWTEEAGGLQCMESQKVRHDWVTNTFTFILMLKTLQWISTLLRVTAKSLKRLSRTKESSTQWRLSPPPLLTVSLASLSFPALQKLQLPTYAWNRQQVFNLRAFALALCSPWHAFPRYAITSWFASFRIFLTSYTFRALFPDQPS